VAVTVHWPTPVPVSALPLTEHTETPAVTAQVTAPLPLPPTVDSALPPPRGIVAGSASAVSVACVARATVTSMLALAGR